jgi:phosphoribosylformylglycinamidine cyclo-ligase
MYGNDYDLVGMITVIVEKSRIITGEAIRSGDVLIGLASNGLHTNGYSLARKVLFEQARLTLHTLEPESGQSVGELLLKPQTCYWPAIAEALRQHLPLHGIAHITGGGIYDNLERILPVPTNAEITPHNLPCPPIFNFIQAHGKISTQEMYRVFNMGVGMIWIVPSEQASTALQLIRNQGFNAARIGEITAGNGAVRIIGVDRDEPGV